MFRVLFFFLFCVTLAADPILVHLGTEEELIPIYLAHFDAAQKELENTLRFDLQNNGTTTVAKSSPDLEILTKDSSLGKMDTISTWRALNIPFVIKGSVQSNQLVVKIFDHGTGTIHTLPPVPLTGNAVNDKKSIHALSDAILKLLFGRSGIASTKIIYTIKNNPNHSEVWEFDYDGSNPKQVTNENTLIVTPVYVPSTAGYASRSAVYVSYKIGVPKIHAISLDQGGTGQRVTKLRGNQLMPAVSPQRNQIVFISDAAGNPDLFMQEFDPTKGIIGEPRQLYAVRHAAQGSPTFSPDGKEIAFVSNKDGRPRLYILTIPPVGTPQHKTPVRLVTKRNAESTAPSWSPDGRQIAYSSKVDGVRQIFVYDLKYDTERQITKGSKNKENPSWAPNSQHLAYNTSANGTSDIYLIDTKHPKPIRLTKGPGEKRFPSWQPLTVK